MRSAILTRARFGAYDPEVWIIQTYLSQLGFSPGTIDGLWGGKTTDAALAFRSWTGLGPASGLTKAGIVDEEFWTQIDRAVASAGFDINISAPSSMPGGSGTRPIVQPVATRPPAAAPPAPTTSMGGGLPMLALAAIGLGAVIVLGGKKRR